MNGYLLGLLENKHFTKTKGYFKTKARGAASDSQTYFPSKIGTE